MVLVPAGKYLSGIAKDEMRRLVQSVGDRKMEDFYSSETPETIRDLPSFYVDVFEVTNAQYGKFMAETRHRAPAYWKTTIFGRPRQPVVGMGWLDAEAYCAWAGRRLPTEFEWEKAARGTETGARKRMWPWGNERNAQNYNGRTTEKRAPVEVGSFPAGKSPYGVHDMAGNVWEMTSSRWPNEDSAGHTIKGGSFLNSLASVRVTVRWAADDEKQGATWLGFRCVRDAP
jgi:iron(II)-dependent oxidoreductase